jgi:hypothetical protein
MYEERGDCICGTVTIRYKRGGGLAKEEEDEKDEIGGTRPVETLAKVVDCWPHTQMRQDIHASTKPVHETRNACRIDRSSAER